MSDRWTGHLPRGAPWLQEIHPRRAVVHALTVVRRDAATLAGHLSAGASASLAWCRRHQHPGTEAEAEAVAILYARQRPDPGPATVGSPGGVPGPRRRLRRSLRRRHR
ncbi:MAG: hypothetical protein ABR564_01660 [Candidatus Dormibacteria bacterium]